MTDETTTARLEYLRAELRAERISWGELAELQGLVEHIETGDVELLEAAGVPEHGRYLPVDLDENNRHSRERYAKRHGREPAPFGWGVCRHGFGLQRHDGILTREQAEAWARELNAAMTIGGER